MEVLLGTNKYNCNLCTCINCNKKAESENDVGCITCYYCAGIVRDCNSKELTNSSKTQNKEEYKMAKYNVSDKFYLDGGQVAYSEMVEIVQILPSLKENEPTYLAVCRRFSVHDESFENISYALHSDITLGECGYVKQ